MALRKKGNTWYAYFRDFSGRIRVRSLRVHTRGEAERLHELYMESIRAAKAEKALRRDFPGARLLIPSAELPPVSVPAAPRHKRLRIADMWELALTRRPLSHSHRLLWESFVSRIGEKFADAVTPAKALAYLETFYAEGNGKTFNNAKSACNTVYRMCLVESGLPSSPFAPIPNRVVTVVEKHRNLTLEEFSRLAEAAPPQLRMVLMLSRWTTQRLETCARMTPEMFDFSRLVFTIDPGKTARFAKWVCVPIMPELESFLRPLLPKCKPGLPLHLNFGNFKNGKLSEKCRELCKKLGILDTSAGKASFHSVRGTAITWFKEHGVKGEELRAITGHASDAVEDIYARDIASLAAIARRFRG